jgi:predicted nuclease of restriction endonuclease-like (RecB) superfamily
VIQRLSADLRAAFPGARGYSVPGLYRMRALAAAWPEGLSDRMRDLPWGHIVTITATATEDARDWYAERAAAWSQEQLEAAIATRLHERQAAAICNFGRTLEAGDAAAVQRITPTL